MRLIGQNYNRLVANEYPEISNNHAIFVEQLCQTGAGSKNTNNTTTETPQLTFS
jgi:hypothetical protein